MTKKSIQNVKYLENEKSFQGEIKSIFHIIFKWLSFAKNCLRPESALLSYILKTPILKAPFFSEDHLVAIKITWLKGGGF